MKACQKIIQLPSNLSKLLDALCFELAVNIPDKNSLSILEIIEWKNNKQIDQDEFRELYCGWLQSKNIYDLFTARQVSTYPKEDLVMIQGNIQKAINLNQITKILETLNYLYNDLYIQKKMKAQPSISKQDVIKSIENVEKLFSFLDSEGVIGLRLNEAFFLTGGILLSEGRTIPNDIQQFKCLLKILSTQMCQINGCISLRAFKNYFLAKSKTLSIQNLTKKLQQLLLLINTKQSEQLPNIFREALEKWKLGGLFKNQQRKYSVVKRIIQENQRIFIFPEDYQQDVFNQLRIKYGKSLLDCVDLDQHVIHQFTSQLNDAITKYFGIIQNIALTMNKNNKFNTPRYIEQGSSNNPYSTFQSGFQTSLKKTLSNLSQHTPSKMQSKTALKQRTPTKKAKQSQVFPYRAHTPTGKSPQRIHLQFGSAQKRLNPSMRQATPTKSTLSFASETRTYRAAEKKGLAKNNFYDKLFFFRNKRVESYQIVMKRLKNK